MPKKRQLRVYFGPNDMRSVAFDQAKQTGQDVQIPLADLIDTLAEASQNRRIWLDDFRNEMVTISTDLYEIILAYQHYKRPSA